MNKILIISEHHGGVLNSVTSAVVTAAKQISESVEVLVCGSGCESVAKEAAKLEGVDKVLLAEAAHHAHPLAEELEPLLLQLQKDRGYTHLLAPASTFGKDVMPRVAAKLDVQQISDIVRVVDASTFVRPIYAGNAMATVQSGDVVKVVTVRPSAFEKVGQGGKAAVEKISAGAAVGRTAFIKLEATKSDRPDLSSARIVISGGRGVGSAENFALIEKLAQKLGAAVGASRAAVDAGYVPNDYQVGQTGKIVAPDLYIAVGISGAIQHLAGMTGSKVIVAINKDEQAPIFEVADYGLVGDLFQLVPELIEKLP